MAAESGFLIINTNHKNYKRYVENYREPKLTSPTDPNQSKEPKLTEAGARGLANLKSPNFIKDSGGKGTYMTPDEVQNSLSMNIQSLAKDILSSRSNNWFFNIVKQWGRIPTSEELDAEIVKHYQTDKTISSKEVEELNKLSEYLEDASDGIKKYQGYNKFFQKKLEEK
jgi:hypothetical protein